MEHISEPKGVDFIIESKPLTDEEERKSTNLYVQTKPKFVTERNLKLSRMIKTSKKNLTD